MSFEFTPVDKTVRVPSVETRVGPATDFREVVARAAAAAIKRRAEARRAALKRRVHAIMSARLTSHPPVQAIILACAAHFDIDAGIFMTKRKTKDVICQKQVAVYLARKLTPHSLPEIGRRFGGRDHTTILHSCNKVAKLVDAGDEKAIADIAAIERILNEAMDEQG